MSGFRAFAVVLLGAGVACAQYSVGARAGTIDLTVGEVYLDNLPVAAGGTSVSEMQPGQILRTGNGRAELLLGPRVFLRLGTSGAVRLVDAQILEPAIEIMSGAAIIEIVNPAKDSRVRVRLGSALTVLKATGVYRFESQPAELRVFGGEVDASAGERRVTAGKGRRIKLDGVLTVSKFDVKGIDELHKWAAARSFDLFVSSGDAVKLARAFYKEPTNWTLTSTGWLYNRDFGMRFYSKTVALEVAAQEKENHRGL